MNTNNGFSNIAIVAIVLAVLVGGGIIWVAAQYRSQSPDNAMMNENDKMMEGDKIMNDEAMHDESMAGEDKMMDDKMEGSMQEEAMTDDAMMQKSGSYKDYSPATVEAEQAAGNKVVLFFHAPWCPFCKAADSAFNSRLKEIPAGVTILKTDYDSNTELRQKYGVTYQHTFVQIDGNENQVTKWNGGDIDNLKKYVK